MTTFCADAGISRKTFYEIRRRALEEGEAAALEPRSRRPRSSPTATSEAVKAEALKVRAALEQSGWDHGPISVHDKMLRMGLTPPSIAALARIFREAGVARLEPRKRPRASWRRFVYPAPNACWQLDATEYVLTRGRVCVIFQLIDDHSRLAIASHVASGETAEGALAVVSKGIERHGVPQRLLSDNGAALNPSRRGIIGQLVAYVTRLGVEAITGKPYKPTTQGKNERIHQTLFRWLDKQPLAESLEQLQALVDEFDHGYNNERGHQALPGRMSPQAAWDATAVAEPPRPQPAEPAQVKPDRYAAGHKTCLVYPRGVITVLGVPVHVGKEHGGTTVDVIWDEENVTVFDARGTAILTFPRPAKGTRYVGNGKPGGFMATPVSPMS